ncbi:hypothetical protein OpiT1DRAFT_04278 [Opitutaceae bacterium TAV1]|nr:hypothetical protein OpiT1DRAFT_04278 [Opitutaceae bacterium TAV1]
MKSPLPIKTMFTTTNVHTSAFAVLTTIILATLTLVASSTASLPPPPSAPSAPAVPTLRLVNNTTVNARAHNFPNGDWGSSINGQTYQQEALVSHRGYQYAAFYVAPGFPAVARRALPDGAWETITFKDYGPVTHSNTHNVIVIGIAPRDGTLHLSFDHHATILRYRKSQPGVATNPTAHRWTPALFGPVTSALEPGKTISRVTYPQFFTAPDGTLTFAFRNGVSGRGDWFLHEYTETNWTPLGQLFTQTGTYQGKNSRSAYPNPYRYDPDGRLHVTWSWREHSSNLTGNHDLGYAWSDDHGRTWHNNNGIIIAHLTNTPTNDGATAAQPASAISINTPGNIVYPIRYAWGMMNTTTQFVDAKRRVHIISWRNPDDAPAPSSNTLNSWRYYHYWRDIDGTWHERQLPFHGRKPQLVLDETGTMHVIHGTGPDLNYHGGDRGVHLAIATATEASGWTDWKVSQPLPPDYIFQGEPLLDVGRWEREKILSIYYQQKPEIPGNPASLRVIDLRP